MSWRRGLKEKKKQKLVANPLKCIPRDPALRGATLGQPRKKKNTLTGFEPVSGDLKSDALIIRLYCTNHQTMESNE